jgi:hypothetical protein
MATICAPSYAGKTRGGGRIVANRGPYSEWSCKRKVGGPDAFSARSLRKWKKRGSLHFLHFFHFVTFGRKPAARGERLSSSGPLGTDEPL